MRLERLEILGLFRRYNYSIDFNQEDGVTIIIGPNGYGKSTVFNLLYAFFRDDTSALRNIEFQRLSLFFNDKSNVVIDRELSHNTHNKKSTGNTKRPSTARAFLYYTFHNKEGETINYRSRNEEICELSLGNDKKYTKILDSNDSEYGKWVFENHIVDIESIISLFACDQKTKEFLKKEVCIPEWLHNILLLNVPENRRWLLRDTSFVRESNGSWMSMLKPSRIYFSNQAVTRWIGRGRDESLQRGDDQESPTSDPKFIYKITSGWREKHAGIDDVIERSNFSMEIMEELLNQIYKYERNASHADCSLEINIENEGAILEKLDELEQFLIDRKFYEEFPIEELCISSNDWYRHDPDFLLSRFYSYTHVESQGILKNIKGFEQYLNERLLFSKIKIYCEGLKIFDMEGFEMPPYFLSSGEQNLLVQAFELFLGDSTMVVIDEPELSLHVSWQAEYIEDIIQIAREYKKDIVLITHSPDIIGSRWDLAVELEIDQLQMENHR